MIGFLADVKAARGLDGLELSIGGGFGIKYVDSDHPVPLGEMCANLVHYAEKALDEKGVTISKLITEPGRAMVGEAGYTIYTIGDMKKSGDKNYIFVDGGMSDNIRHALYDAEYTAVLPEKLSRTSRPVGRMESVIRAICSGFLSFVISFKSDSGRWQPSAMISTSISSR